MPVNVIESPVQLGCPLWYGTPQSSGNELANSLFVSSRFRLSAESHSLPKRAAWRRNPPRHGVGCMSRPGCAQVLLCRRARVYRIGAPHKSQRLSSKRPPTSTEHRLYSHLPAVPLTSIVFMFSSLVVEFSGGRRTTDRRLRLKRGPFSRLQDVCAQQISEHEGALEPHRAAPRQVVQG